MRWDPCLVRVPQDLAKQTGLGDCLPGGLGRPKHDEQRRLRRRPPASVRLPVRMRWEPGGSYPLQRSLPQRRYKPLRTGRRAAWDLHLGRPGRSGVCPVPALRQAGVPIGIGTDGSASNDSQNMLEAVKTAALLQKVARLDPRALTAGDVLAMATVEGARALGLERRIGSLEPGKRADVVRLRGDRPGLANVHDPRQQVVYCTSPSDVADVWVAGGQLVDHDLAALVEASRPLAAELVALAGLGGRSRLA